MAKNVLSIVTLILALIGAFFGVWAFIRATRTDSDEFLPDLYARSAENLPKSTLKTLTETGTGYNILTIERPPKLAPVDISSFFDTYDARTGVVSLSIPPMQKVPAKILVGGSFMFKNTNKEGINNVMLEIVSGLGPVNYTVRAQGTSVSNNDFVTSNAELFYIAPYEELLKSDPVLDSVGNETKRLVSIPLYNPTIFG